MAIISQVPLDFKAAWDLADLEGRKHDLEWVKEAGQKYLKCSNEIEDFIIHEVFCSAIIIRYGRANTTGRKKRIPDECFKSLTQEERNNHDYFMNLRNLHYAHSVNDYECNIPKVWIKNIDSSNPELDQVGVIHNRVIKLSIKEMQDVVSLADKLLLSLESHIEKEREKVTEIVKNIPIDQLIQNKFPEIVSTRKTVGESRKRK